MMRTADRCSLLQNGLCTHPVPKFHLFYTETERFANDRSSLLRIQLAWQRRGLLRARWHARCESTGRHQCFYSAGVKRLRIVAISSAQSSDAATKATSRFPISLFVTCFFPPYFQRRFKEKRATVGTLVLIERQQMGSYHRWSKVGEHRPTPGIAESLVGASESSSG